MGEFLLNTSFGFSSIINVLCEHIGVTPWEGPWEKVKVLMDAISALIGLVIFAWVLFILFKKYVSGPKEGIEPSWNKNDIITVSSFLFAVLISLTPLGGAIIGNLIVWIIK